MKKSTIYLFVIGAMVFADTAILFETDFSSLPDGWQNDVWVFNHPGAYIGNGVQNSSWDAEFSSFGPTPVLYFVPDGTDSVVIHLEHELIMEGSYYSAGIQLWTSLTGWTDHIYYEAGAGWFEDAEPIQFVIEDPASDTWLGFRFRGELSAGYMMYAGMTWNIFSMSVTANGETLGLAGSTWASIKNCLGSI